MESEENLEEERPSPAGGAGVEPAGQPTQPVGPPPGVPWITYSIIAVCAAICLYFNVIPESAPSYKQIAGILAPSALQIWGGAYWGLLTSAFVHLAFWHLLFNMWWARDFGALLEPAMGRVRYPLFIAAAAMVSSGAQLAFSDQTGIGFSGVVYAMFGYALAARRVEPQFQRIVSKSTIQWLLGWMVLCIVLTVAKVWNVANWAHGAGFLFGYCVGNGFAARVQVVASRIGAALLVGLAVMSAVYMPWSPAFVAYGKLEALADAAAAGDPQAQLLEGAVAQQAGRKEEALSWFRKSASQGNVQAMNQLAWALATERDDRLRDGAEAVRWAERACREDGQKTAAYLDTLAAAYAEVERWDDAVATEKLALAKLPAAEAETRPGYEARLQQYLRHEKARD